MQLRTFILIFCFCHWGILNAVGQSNDSILIQNNVIRIKPCKINALAMDIKAKRSIHLKVGSLNFSNDSCRIGFRLFLSFNNQATLNLDSENYVGSYFMGHDCNTVFIMPLEETVRLLFRPKMDITNWYFTFQFIDAQGKVMENGDQYLGNVKAKLLRH